MLPDKIEDPEKYIKPDKADGGLKSMAPLGFTGQGAIWYAATAPAGWLECDGSSVEKDLYPELWELLGDTWGASTSTHFVLPNLDDRAPVGGGTLAATGTGAHTHTLDDDAYAKASPDSTTLDVARRTVSAWTANHRQITTSPAIINTSETLAIALGGTTNSSSPQPPHARVMFIIKT